MSHSAAWKSRSDGCVALASAGISRCCCASSGTLTSAAAITNTAILILRPHRQRRDVGGDVEDVVAGHLVQHRLHESDPRPFAHALLHVVHLARNVTGRTAGNTRHRSQPL